MILAYWVITGFLGFVWVLGFFGSIWGMLDDNADKEAWQLFSAVMAGLLFVVFIWPALIVLAFPVWFLYGCWQGIKLTIKKVVGA